MCDAISFSLRHLPVRYQNHQAITSRIVDRGGDVEVHFYFNAQPYPSLLPIILDEEFRIVRWGNERKKSRMLPHGGQVRWQELKQRRWQRLHVKEVEIQAHALLHRRVWISVIEGVRGVYAIDEHGTPTAYIVMEKSTDYYQIMTRSWLMPSLIGEVI